MIEYKGFLIIWANDYIITASGKKINFPTAEEAKEYIDELTSEGE